MAIRYISKFEYADGQFFVFPRYRYEYEPSQDLVLASAPLSGGSYEYDLLGNARAPKKNAVHRLRFLMVGAASLINADLASLRAALYEGALGKVWSKGTELDDHGGEIEVERWARGRIMSMPSVQLSVEGPGHLPSFVTFQTSSDFYSSALQTDEFDVSASPTTITVVNPGTAPIYNATITLKGTFTNPKVQNQRNGYTFESARDGASADDWLQLIAPRRVRFSDDGGDTWTGDYANVTRNLLQLMLLEPGSNDLVVTGMTDGTVEVSFYPAWH